jgi:hypothetical protein
MIMRIIVDNKSDNDNDSKETAKKLEPPSTLIKMIPAIIKKVSMVAIGNGAFCLSTSFLWRTNDTF